MVRMHCPCLWTVEVSCRREICHLCAISEAHPRCPCAQQLLDPWRCPVPPHRPPQGIVHPTRHPPYGPDPPDDLDARVTTQPNVLSLDADFSNLDLGMPVAKVDDLSFFVVFSNHPLPMSRSRLTAADRAAAEKTSDWIAQVPIPLSHCCMSSRSLHARCGLAPAAVALAVPAF